MEYLLDAELLGFKYNDEKGDYILQLGDDTYTLYKMASKMGLGWGLLLSNKYNVNGMRSTAYMQDCETIFFADTIRKGFVGSQAAKDSLEVMLEQTNINCRINTIDRILNESS